MQEKRAHPRTPVSFDVTVETAAGVQTGHARDISVGGMFIETDAQFEFGSEATISCTFPGSEARFALPAIVRWAAPGGVGVQFGLLGARETHAIVQLMKH